MRKNVQDDREKKDIACKMSELHHGRLVAFYDSLTKNAVRDFHRLRTALNYEKNSGQLNRMSEDTNYHVPDIGNLGLFKKNITHP